MHAGNWLRSTTKPVFLRGVPEAIWKRARIAAVERDTTLGKIVTEALTTWLAKANGK